MIVSPKDTGALRMIFDLHTHTVYSSHGHGKGTIEENVTAARKKGLKRIGISDHGPDHILFGVKEENYFRIRQEVERLKLKYKDIEILLGIEANIINQSGKLAVSKEQAAMFDYIMAGYHFGTIGESAGRSLFTHCMNLFDGAGQGKKAKTTNTKLVIQALENNQITVLTHPGCKGEIFVKEVAEVCARRGTLMEINNSHGKLDAEQLKEAAKTDVQFIIGSDAHRPENIGGFENALAEARKAKIDLGRIVNLAF